MNKLKKGVIDYLNERIKMQENLLKIAEKRGNEKMKLRYEYGLGILRGVKRDVTEDPCMQRYYGI